MASNNVNTMKRSSSLRFDTGRFRRNFQKHLSRTKEKVFNNLDKGERTDDDFIKKSEAVLIRKQASTVKLQTELKRHLKALKNVSASSRSLHETMLDAYEDNWAGRKEFAEALVNLDSCWLHYFNTLCTVLEQVGTHLDSFVTIKDKMEKRKRKLVDYNLAKRNLHQIVTAKKRDESKAKKARRDVEFVELAYTQLNTELRRDLPSFYDTHVHFCCENWSYMLENERNMYEEICKTVDVFISSLNKLRQGYNKSEYQLDDVDLSYSEISRSSISLAFEPAYSNGDVYELLSETTPNRQSFLTRSQPPGRGVQTLQRPTVSNNPSFRNEPVHASFRSQSVDDLANMEDSDGYGTLDFLPPPATHTSKARINLRHPSPRSPAQPPSPNREESVYNADHHVYAEPDLTKKRDRNKSATPSESEQKSPNNEADTLGSSPSSSLSSRQYSIAAKSTSSSSPRVERSRRFENLPMMIVKHPYTSQDDDELDLEINDLVQVLPWENENLKEDGWMFGMKLPDGKKGLFPENHTNAFVTPDKK